MNALANPEVGDYLNRHFISTVLKAGTFAVANGQKQGGNVASYFCTADGAVLHAIAGPVDAETMLQEARWVVNTRNLAVFESRGNANHYREFIRKAHGDRLEKEFGIDPRELARSYVAMMYGSPGQPADPLERVSLDRLGVHGRLSNGVAGNQARIHALLVAYPLIRVEQFYKHVFERILGQKVSTLPVQVR